MQGHCDPTASGLVQVARDARASGWWRDRLGTAWEGGPLGKVPLGQSRLRGHASGGGAFWQGNGRQPLLPFSLGGHGPDLNDSDCTRNTVYTHGTFGTNYKSSSQQVQNLTPFKCRV